MLVSDDVRIACNDKLYLQTYDFSAIDNIWHEIEPLLSKRLFRNHQGRYTIADIRKHIAENHQQIWIARNIQTDSLEMVCITEVYSFPDVKILAVTEVAGKSYKNWIWILPEIETFAKSIGCSYVEAEGRRGWKKIVQKYGWKEDKVKFIKKL